MDKILEQKFIRSFIKNEFQGRRLFELANGKRDVFIHKMSQYWDKYIKNDCILQEGSQNPSLAEIRQSMRQYDAVKKFYVISEYEDLDGIYTDLETAVERFSVNGFASFIVGLPSGFTHGKGESLLSRQPNFYLKPQHRFDGVLWNGEQP